MSLVQNNCIKLIVLSMLAGACTESSTSLTLAEQGVATGAVIGAGVGALVGSTAGEAGAGVVMGTIAGATSGGVIGSSIEGQEARIDKQDEILGVDTSKEVTQKRSRLKSKNKDNLDDSTQEESFLGRYIWNRGPNSSDSSEVGESSISLTPSNRPSGNRGLAAKYGQIKRPERTEDIVLKAPENIQTSQIRAKVTEKPQVELTQPKENQLPKARVAQLPDTDSLLVQAKPVISLTKTELPPVKGQLPLPVLTKQKEIPPTLPTAKRTIIEPLKAQADNTSSKIENTKVELDTSAAKSVEDVKKTAVVLDEKVDVVTPKSVAKSVEVVQGNKCVMGQAEIKRAASSASDSDKVFYLRRAILACPEETSLRVDLAKVYGRLGLKDDAKREFTSAIEIDPSNETAQEELSIMMLEGSK